MKRSYYSNSTIFSVALLAGLWAIACSSDNNNTSSTGGSSATGGTSAMSTSHTGGSTGTPTGGSTGHTGGAVSTAVGGATSTSTAATAAGGTAAGGTSAAATTAAAGNTAVGGVTSTGAGGTHAGGTSAVGGITSTGGTTPLTTLPDGGTAFPCPGCLKVYVPLDASGLGTDVELDYGTSTTVDLTSVVVTAHVYVDSKDNNGGGVQMYAKNDSVTSYATKYFGWESLSTANEDGWYNISFDFSTVAVAPTPSVSGTFDKSIVRWIGFNVTSGSADAGTFGDVTLYVDYIHFTPVADASASTYPPDNIEFGTTVQGFAINTYNSPVVGSAVTFYKSP